MSFYKQKRNFSNYHYGYNALSEDNPFKVIGTSYNPYQPKNPNQPPQPQYEATLNPQRSDRINQYNSNENKAWQRTNSTSTLRNNIPYNTNTYNPYARTPNFNNNYNIPARRDHVKELLNFTGREALSYFGGNNIQKDPHSVYSTSKTPYQIESYQNNISTIKNVDNLEEQIKNMNDLSTTKLNSMNKNNLNDNNKGFNDTKTLIPLKTNNQQPQYNLNNKYYEERKTPSTKYDNININNSNPTNIPKNSVSEKLSNIDLSEYYEDNCKIIKNYAYKENPNSRYRDYMEDKGRVIENFNEDYNNILFCLFDGHGGGEVSKFLQSNFHIFMKESLPYNDVKKGFINLFNTIDQKIKESNFFQVGATACIIYITNENNKKILYSVNVGDTRSVLIKNNEYRRLSYDHRASDPNEYNRIMNEGGIVFAGRVYGQLMLSRAFGDWELKSYGVSCEPHITRVELNDDDKYLVVATDGVWDVLEDVDVYNMSIEMNNSKEFCNKIIQTSLDKGTMDNLSCFVIKLN